MRKIINFNIVSAPLFVFCIIVFFIAIEICARIDDKIRYDAAFFGDYSDKILRTIDDENIPINVPSVRFEKWINNKQGFRGAYATYPKPVWMKSIACMGTSETYGLYENENKEWPAQLNDMLEPLKKVEAYNVARVGLGLNQFVPYIDKYVAKYKPDFVVLMVNPFAYASWQERVRIEGESKNSPVIEKSNKSQKSVDESVINSDAAFLLNPRYLTGKLRSIGKIKQTFKQFVPENIIKRYQYQKSFERNKKNELKILGGRQPLDNVPIDDIQSFRDEVQEIVLHLKENGIVPIICSYPVLISTQNYDKYPVIMLGARRYCVEFSLKGIIDISKKADSALEDLSKRNSAIYIDLNGTLNHKKKYFADNVHYTDEGAYIVAKTIYDHMTEKMNLLP